MALVGTAMATTTFVRHQPAAESRDVNERDDRRSPTRLSQFALPRGLVGHAAGWIMAVKNRPMNRLAVELLDPDPADRILEIGIGAGAALQMLARRAGHGRIAGVDPSATMLKQARWRNRRAVAAGVVELRQADAARLPFDDGGFAKVFAVNSFHLWPAPLAGLAEARRVLAPGGMLLLALRMSQARPARFSAPGFTEAQVQHAAQLAQHAGFQDVRLLRRRAGREATCLLAWR